jgi:hypothetical protein
MKKSIELYKEYRSQPKTKNSYPSLVQRSHFKDSIAFSGGNKTVREMYERYQKNKK